MILWATSPEPKMNEAMAMLAERLAEEQEVAWLLYMLEEFFCQSKST
jgi:hypothetical protein